ncbi:MAG: hypothetical protein IJP48_05695 [Synergistaceae bacterium]|nr:hypothetical protein [Synergistaceae bacterium]
MKIITFDDIAALRINPAVCYNWVEHVIKNKELALLPPKISMKPFPSEKIFCNVMPCVIPGEISPLGFSVGGVKIVTRYPQRQPALDSKLFLFNADTGENLALIDANFITAMRTGAVAAHSIKLFARHDYNNLAIMGLGNTARAVVQILAEIEKESWREINIKLLEYKSQEILFTERFKNYSNLKFEYASSPEALIQDSDVILSAVTYAAKDFCPDNNYFKEGVLVVPVHTLGFTNCDLFFDKIYADDTGHVRHFKNFAKFKFFSEVCEVVNKNSPGRENDRERILVYNIGISLHDIYFAANIYKLCDSSMSINFHEPDAKFWL